MHPARNRPEAGSNDPQPKEKAVPGKYFARQPDPEIKSPIRIKHGNADGEKAHEQSLNFSLDALLVSSKECFRVHGYIALKQIGGIELAQDTDDFPLGRCGIPIFVQTDMPHLIYVSATIEHGHKMVGGFAQSKKLIVSRILKDVPLPAAKMLAMNIHSGMQSGR